MLSSGKVDASQAGGDRQITVSETDRASVGILVTLAFDKPVFPPVVEP